MRHTIDVVPLLVSAPPSAALSNLQLFVFFRAQGFGGHSASLEGALVRLHHFRLVVMFFWGGRVPGTGSSSVGLTQVQRCLRASFVPTFLRWDLEHQDADRTIFTPPC